MNSDRLDHLAQLFATGAVRRRRHFCHCVVPQTAFSTDHRCEATSYTRESIGPIHTHTDGQGGRGMPMHATTWTCCSAPIQLFATGRMGQNYHISCPLLLAVCHILVTHSALLGQSPHAAHDEPSHLWSQPTLGHYQVGQLAPAGYVVVVRTCGPPP